jgi:hypothetical protein
MGEAFWVPITTFAGGLGVASALLLVRHDAPAEPAPPHGLLVSRRSTTGRTQP